MPLIRQKNQQPLGFPMPTPEKHARKTIDTLLAQMELAILSSIRIPLLTHTKQIQRGK